MCAFIATTNASPWLLYSLIWSDALETNLSHRNLMKVCPGSLATLQSATLPWKSSILAHSYL